MVKASYSDKRAVTSREGMDDCLDRGIKEALRPGEFKRRFDHGTRKSNTCAILDFVFDSDCMGQSVRYF